MRNLQLLELENISNELRSLALLVGSLTHLKDLTDENLYSYTLYFLETEIIKRAEILDPNNS